MRPRGFIERWTPRQKSLDLLKHVEAIIADYRIALTIRQIFYRLVARYRYPKTELAYDNLGELLARARRARRIPMEAIRDDTFISYYPRCWDSAEQFMADVRRDAARFRIDRQKEQRRRLVVMCEAGGMALQLFAVTEPYGIEVLSGGGFDSVSDKHRLAEEWASSRQPVTVLRIGDYDPSGESMFTVLLEDIGAFVKSYRGDVKFVPVAIAPEQARRRVLPSAPPNPKDNRGAHCTDSETWQAEALDPNDLADILEAPSSLGSTARSTTPCWLKRRLFVER